MLMPQDIVVLLKEHFSPADPAVHTADLGIPRDEVAAALERLSRSRLWSPLFGIQLHNTMEFLIHGVRYAFPTEVGADTVGFPTGHSAAPLVNLLRAGENYVWPDPNGPLVGRALEPLHPAILRWASQPASAAEYRAAALIDALRVGRSRERRLAERLLADEMQQAFERQTQRIAALERALSGP